MPGAAVPVLTSVTVLPTDGGAPPTRSKGPLVDRLLENVSTLKTVPGKTTGAAGATTSGGVTGGVTVGVTFTMTDKDSITVALAEPKAVAAMLLPFVTMPTINKAQ